MEKESAFRAEAAPRERRLAWIRGFLIFVVPLTLFVYVPISLRGGGSAIGLGFGISLAIAMSVALATWQTWLQLSVAIEMSREGITVRPGSRRAALWVWGRLTPITHRGTPKWYGLYEVGLRTGPYVLDSCYLTTSQVAMLVAFPDRPQLEFDPVGSGARFMGRPPLP